MRTLDSLQLGRGAAVLSVFVLHLLTLSVEYQHGYFAYSWTPVLRAGVDVFFVISGVVMVVTTYNKFGKTGTGKRFLIHRVSRIYPPYLILTAVLTVFWFLRPSAVDSKTGVDLFSSFTLWPSVGRLPLVQVAWSLSFEMMFYLVFFLLIVFMKRRWLPQALLLWSVIVLAGSTAIALDSSGTLVTSFPRANFFLSVYVLEFVAGCFIGFALLKANLMFGRTSVAIATVLFVAEAAVFEAIKFDGNYHGGLRVLLFGVPAVLLIYGLLAWEQEAGSLHVPRWLIRCGDMSYSIYLVHTLVIHFAYRYSWRFVDHDWMRPLFLLSTSCMAVLTSIIFYRVVEKPSSAWTRARLEGIFKIRAKAAVAPSPVVFANSPE